MMNSKNRTPEDPLDKLDRVIDKLEGEEWVEITKPELHLHPPKGSTVVEADASGKMRAVSIPDSDPPQPEGIVPVAADSAGKLIGKVDSWPKAAALIALAALAAFAAWLRWG